MRLFFVLILLVTISGCNTCKEIKLTDEISKIRVYYLPFDIMSTVGAPSKTEILEYDNITIKDSTKIKKILNEISLLSKAKRGVYFDENYVYLRVDFYDNKNENIETLLFDKSHFKLNNCFYDDNNTLINLLIEDFEQN